MRRKIFIFLLLQLLPLFVFARSGYFSPWGKDSDIRNGGIDKKVINNKSSIALFIADKVIAFHQNVLSPVDGPRSSFRPTSSRYMQLAMRRYGFFKGYIMGCDRLLRENDEKWVYRTKVIDGVTYKFDPAILDKFSY